MTVRVAASSGAVDTFKVTEWLGKTLPPNVAGYQKGFFNRYQDPTENRAQLDALAAEFPNLVTPVNLPNLTNGYQRKSQAIMYGTTAIGSTPPVTLGPPLINTTGEITAAQPVASHPVHRHRGADHPRDRRTASRAARPTSSSTIKDPAGTVLQSIDTGTSPEIINQTLPTAGTYTYEVSGFQGDLGDFTFTDPGRDRRPDHGGRADRQGVGPRPAATRSPPSSRTRAPTTRR